MKISIETAAAPFHSAAAPPLLNWTIRPNKVFSQPSPMALSGTLPSLRSSLCLRSAPLLRFVHPLSLSPPFGQGASLHVMRGAWSPVNSPPSPRYAPTFNRSSFRSHFISSLSCRLCDLIRLTAKRLASRAPVPCSTRFPPLPPSSIRFWGLIYLPFFWPFQTDTDVFWLFWIWVVHLWCTPH